MVAHPLHRTHRLLTRLHAPLLLALLIAFLYISTKIDQATLERYASGLGLVGIGAIALFILATQVFAPLSGSPGVFVAIRLYGYPVALVTLYVASMISAALNFWIARRYGRPVVRRLVGEKGIKDIDLIASSGERSILISSRIFGYYFFDIISYAAGITNVSFGKFYLYTATLTIIPMVAQFYAFRGLDFSSPRGISIYYGSLLLVGLVFARVFYKIVRARRSSDCE